MLHGCTIGNRVLVEMGSIILDGALVEDDVIIGTGQPGGVGQISTQWLFYFSRPARRVRRLMPVEIGNLIYSVNNYIQWKDDYLL